MAQAAARRGEVGRALCIGVDADADARMFAALALERGFLEPVVLLGEQATRAAVRAQLAEMAERSEPGDLFLLTFSGHGGRRRVSGQPDALSQADAKLLDVATWQLYDGALNDLQLKADIAAFRAGVRVLVVSDNCGGGLPARCSIDLAASVLVLAACEVGKYADGPGLPGHFAGTLLRLLRARRFAGTHRELHEALCDAMPSYQRPDCYGLGEGYAAFEAQAPLVVRFAGS